MRPWTTSGMRSLFWEPLFWIFSPSDKWISELFWTGIRGGVPVSDVALQQKSRWFVSRLEQMFFFFFCRLIIASGLLVSCVHPAGVKFLWIKYNLSALLYVASWRRAEIKCSAVAEWQGTLVLHPQSQSEWGRLCPRPVCPFTSMHVCVSMCECMSLCDPPCMHTLLCK